MKNQHFDKWDFDNAISVIETNPKESKQRLEEYLKKYSDDYSSYIYYAFSLIKLGDFTTAETIINKVEELVENDYNYQKDENSLKHFNKHLISAKIKLLSYQKKYYKLYKLFLKYSEVTKSQDLNRTFFYCKKKLGLLDPNKRNKNSYIFRQTIEYKEDDFLEHIKNHLTEYNEETNEANDCFFYSSFPFKSILEEIKKIIPCEKRIYPGDYDNLYIFKYDSCGKVNSKSTDYFKVVCFHDTKDIITMYPADDCEHLPYIDLNYLKEEKNTPKVKRLSQIDKFNQRYKK